MKKVIFFVLLSVMALVICSCSKKDTEDIDVSVIEKQSVIKFDNDILDFHTLNAGERVTGSFKFKNAGKNDLIISDVSANCGCTVVDFPKKPIKQNEEGMISVTYDSKGAGGMRIQKQVTVLANTNPSKTILTIVADVK